MKSIFYVSWGVDNMFWAVGKTRTSVVEYEKAFFGQALLICKEELIKLCPSLKTIKEKEVRTITIEVKELK